MSALDATTLVVGGGTAGAGVLGVWAARQVGRAARKVGAYLAEIARLPSSVDDLVDELRTIRTEVQSHESRISALEILGRIIP